MLGAFLGVACASLAAGDPPDPDAPGLTTSQRFEALMARITYEQERLRTLEARFVQRKESELLLEPEEIRGTFSFEAPEKMRWDYEAPADMVVLVRGGEVLTWYRGLGRVERLDVGRQGDQVLRFLGAGASLETLQRYFTISATFPADASEPYLLRLEPSTSRVARRVRSMTLRLDRQLLVPVYVRYDEPGGGVTELRFEDVRVNAVLPDDRFELELPEGVDERVVGLGG